jgi:uncharacterized protein YcbX
MRVVELWRHPVKSLQGESLSRAELETNGVSGDRSWGIVDQGTSKVLTARREPVLLLAAARLDDDGTPVLDLPNGDHVEGPGDATDERLSNWLGRPVRLVSAQATNPGVAEFFEDATDDTSRAIEWTMPAGRFVDALPLLVLTTASLRRAAALYPDGVWATRRLRPNIVVDVDGEGWVEDAWCQREVRIGEATIVPVAPCERCTMVTRPQPGLDRDLDIFRTLARHHNAKFGVWSGVAAPGSIHVGDAVAIE